MSKEVNITCPECDGVGSYDVMDCKDFSNECCGGCYRTIKCETCNGTGEIVELIDEEDENN